MVRLEIVRVEPGGFGYSRQHFGSKSFAIVKRKNCVWPTLTCENFMRPSLTFDLPLDPEKRREHPFC